MVGCSEHSHPGDPGRALDEARRLAKEGDYEGALSNHVWFHNNVLAIAPNYYGVRLSFALNDWVKLGEKYPKALAKLKEIRDADVSRLVGGDKDEDLFHDVAAINGYLKDPNDTVELFKRLEGGDSQFAQRIYHSAEDALVQAKEFRIARKYLSDPEARLTHAKRTFADGMQFAQKTRIVDASRRAYEHIFSDDVVHMILILHEAGDAELARRIQSEALKTADLEAIKNAIKL